MARYQKIDDQLTNLNVDEEENEDLVLGGDIEEEIDKYELCLVGRFLTEKNINTRAMRSKLADVWKPKMGINIKELETGIFLFQFFHKEDKAWVINAGPWSFNNAMLLIEEIPEGEEPLKVPLWTLNMWIQIYDLPSGFMTEAVGVQLGNFFGTFITYDNKNNNSIWREYMRIKVRIDVRKPLKRKKKIKRKNGSEFVVSCKYERLGDFCFACGLVSHTERFCRRTLDSRGEGSSKEWGTWLRAPSRRGGGQSGSKWLREEDDADWAARCGRDNNIPYSGLGGEFTWEKSKGSPNWVRERLDRAFANSEWWQKFPLYKLTVAHVIKSDHDPIIMEPICINHSRKQFRFKFENTWLSEPNFKKEVTEYWKSLPVMHMLPKLLSASSFLAKWGRNFFHKFRDKVKKQKEALDMLKDRIDDVGIQQYFAEKSKLDDLLFHEEQYWRQRAKSFWLTEGDTNSKFFHSAATKRKKKNHINHLINEEGQQVTEKEGMNEMVVDYFRNVFACGNDVDEQELLNEGRVITDEHNIKLTADITIEELSEAIRQMHPDKSARPDGYSPAFFQHFWDILGPEIFKCCTEWLKEISFPATLNDTTLVLIPKKENAEKLTDLRPIALCNVLYKILAKVLANQLKVILPGVISENQTAFVPGRNISDNVLVAFELLHHMKRKNRGSEGEVALKLDISKAYDRVRWDYLKNRMKDMGFSERWVKWIMLCVRSVSYMVNFNGQLVGPIIPRRGLRQGDPLSPYLFLFCVEGLSHLINNAVEGGSITGSQIAANAPKTTHLLFADDSFLFFKATEGEAVEVRNLLNKYESNSRQAVNYQKSGIFSSANVRMDKQVEIKRTLGVSNDLGNSKYLGLSSLIGRAKKSVFNFIKERIWRKVQDWSHKNLSKAGKIVMIKNVAQSIPAYSMSCFLIPKSLCTEIERLMNGYWWGSGGNNAKGIRWFGWNKMAGSKCKGRLGFRDLHGFNLALLGKQVWRICSNPDSLVARLFKARYFLSNHILNAKKGSGSSFEWNGIWEAKEQLKKGFRWILGDGKDIRIFHDPWLRGKGDYCVEDNHLNGIRNESVSCYFRPQTNDWDVHKVQRDFHDSDVQLILQTRIPQNRARDKVAWMASNTGEYSVKTGYQLWLSQFPDNIESNNSTGWNKLWNLRVPHKVRTFLWRFCTNTIPVRNLLRSKGVNTTIMCPLCNVDVEHLLHVFFDCRFASECWSKAGIVYDMQRVEEAPP
ncbi:uncharacterized protein LOC141659976 [Apium graveolens]|uniref:uncharacterized protein LOC141659976 n=1 Tax=Apium graveolens TaxID=4045 RepID=UPI003D78F33B